MKCILGPPFSFKTTLSFHHTYEMLAQEIEHAQAENSSIKEDDLPYALYLTSKPRLDSNSLIFGTYSEVTIDFLKQIKLKYVENFDKLIGYLSDIHLLERPPHIIAIDSLEYLLTGSSTWRLSQLTSMNQRLKAEMLVSLLLDTQSLLPNTKIILTQRVFSSLMSSSEASSEPSAKDIESSQ